MKLAECLECPGHGACIMRDLPAEAVADFQASAKFSLYRPRQLVFHEESFTNGLYMLCRGVVRLYQSSAEGQSHVLGIATAGEILAELLIEPKQLYSVSAEALVDSQVCYVPADALVQLVHRHPIVGVRLIAALSKSLRAARAKARALALRRPIGRLAALLLELRASSGRMASRERVPLPYSRWELAEMIGVSQETVIRLLGKLKREGIVEADLHSFVVVDPTRLGRVVEGEHRVTTRPRHPAHKLAT